MMTETDKIEHNGALNLRVLKQIQEMVYIILFVYSYYKYLSVIKL